MIATCVHIKVKLENIADFKKASIDNHNQSVKEPGNLRFDILQESNDHSLFMFYEAYESEDAAAAHKETLHYSQWRDLVALWMADPRKGIKYNIISSIEK